MTAILVTILGTGLFLRHLSEPPPYLDAPFSLYPVSILKPLKGTDPGLRENLESFFNLEYPAFEIIFSVANPQDPATGLINDLIAKYPQVKARLICGEVHTGVNPKVNNLVRSYESSRYPLLLISDSNVRVSRDYLKRLVAHLDPAVGLVTSLVTGTHAQGLGGKLERTFLNSFYARGMLIADAAGKQCATGKSMLFMKSVAERFGGIKVLGRYLAEDFMFGEAIQHLGLKVVIAKDPVRQIIGNHGVRQFWNRHVRWGRIRKTQAPLAFAIEPWLGCFASGLVGSAAFSSLTGLTFSAFMAIHLLIWATSDYLIARRLEKSSPYAFAPIWLIRELLALPLWLHTASGNQVAWRGNQFTLKAGGLLESRTNET